MRRKLKRDTGRKKIKEKESKCIRTCECLERERERDSVREREK